MTIKVSLFFFLYFLFFHEHNSIIAQTEWDGDPKVCTVSPSKPASLTPTWPTFPKVAQFTIETVTNSPMSGSQDFLEMTRTEYMYDYTENVMIKSTYLSGSVHLTHYLYSALVKKTYLDNKFCIVGSIEKNNSAGMIQVLELEIMYEYVLYIDGESAFQLEDETWHIRPLNELLLFSNERLTEPTIMPEYVGQSMIRGIAVNQWQSCIVDKINYRTTRRIWSFAVNKTITTPNEMNGNSNPIHLSIIQSLSDSNGTELGKIEATMHVIAFQPGIIADPSALHSPKGIFCRFRDPDLSLATLNELDIAWPHRFSVRIDVSTSKSNSQQSFKFYFAQSNERTILRYDYLPSDTGHLTTLILDVTNDLTYTIDQHTGTCNFHRGTAFIDVNPISKPIEFFMKNEPWLVRSSTEKLWHFEDFRVCRGEEIRCLTVRALKNNFPPLFDDDTDRPTDASWFETHVEYAWSVRSPVTSTTPDETFRFDYPVSLFMRLHKSKNTGGDLFHDTVTEEIEYQFYEMSTDIYLDDFDLSSCYRTMNLSYVHLAFVLLPIDNRLLIGVQLDRQMLEQTTRRTIAEKLQVTLSRISNIQIELIQSGNRIYVFFTLLGPSPLSDNMEIPIETAQQNLQDSIDSGEFKIDIKLIDKDQPLKLWAQSNSLKTSKEFMSIHSNWPFNDVSTCNISSTNFTNTNFSRCNSSTGTASVSIIYHQKTIDEKYTTASELAGVFGGLVVGIVVGFISILLIRFIRKRNPSNSTSPDGHSVINPNWDRTRSSATIPMTNFNQNTSNQNQG